MKRTKLLVGIIAVALGAAQSVVHAKLPASSIIVGNTAYNINYITNHADTVNQQVMNNLGNLYYVDSSGNAKDIFSGANISESQIIKNIGTTLISYDATGNPSTYTSNANSGGFIEPQNGVKETNAIIDASYTIINDVLGLKVINLSIRSIAGVNDATYFVISDNSPTTDNLIPISNQATYFSSSSDIYQSKTITIYDSNRIAIYSGTVEITASGTDKTGSVTKTVNLYQTENGGSSTNTEIGNMAGNITNNGMAAIDSSKKFIYYVNTTDGNKIYKKSVDGLDDYPINDENSKSISIVGNWIYYINGKDSNKIYKVKLDGTGRQKVIDDMASYVTVIGNNIYYINQSDGGKVYVYNSAGKKILSNSAAKFLSVYGNSVFYSNVFAGNKLYKVTYSGSGANATVGQPTKLNDIPANYIVATNDSTVYYTSTDGKLYKCVGTNNIPISVITNIPSSKSGTTTMNSVSDKMTDICVDKGENVYYKSYADPGRIYKLDSTYNGYRVVNDALGDAGGLINIIDSSGAGNTNSGYIYYVKALKLYRVPIDTDGTAKPEAVVKNNSSVKVKSVLPIPTITTDNVNSVSFPERLPVIMSDDNTQQIVVNWDRNSVKFTKGVYTYTGTLLGYGNKVTLNVSIATAMPTSVTVKNNPGSKDVVTVSGLNPGDVVNVYNTSDDTKPLKNGTAGANGIGIVSGLNLNSDEGVIYVTVTTKGKAESGKLAVAYSAEAPSGFNVSANDNKITGLKNNKKYIMYMYDATVLDDTKVDWSAEGNNVALSVKPVRIEVTSDSNGIVDLTKYLYKGSLATFNGIISDPSNGGKDMSLRLKQKGDSEATNSDPSSAINISKAAVPGTVGINYQSGQMYGTDVTMQYSYIDPGKDNTQWKDCPGGVTTVDLSAGLQIWVRVKPNGSIIGSDPKAFSLFVPPTVTGITEGGIYSVDKEPTPTWTVIADTQASITTEVDAKIREFNANEPDDTKWTLVKDYTSSSGKSLDVSSGFTSDKVYAFVLTEKKTINKGASNEKSGTAKVIIKFTVNSNKPSPFDITVTEDKGTVNTIDTYYKATPSWSQLAGTNITSKLYRIDTPTTGLATLPVPTDPANDDFVSQKAAGIDFITSSAVTQPGYYKLEVTAINRTNGAKTTVYKYFIIDPTSVTVANMYSKSDSSSLLLNGSTYKDISIYPEGYTSPNTKVDIAAAGNLPARFVTAQIRGISGLNTPYTFGQNITVNGDYTLIVTTTNKINGLSQISTYNFTVKNDASTTIPDAPKAKLSVSGGKYVISLPDNNLPNPPGVTYLKYSVNGGVDWFDVNSDGIIPDDKAAGITETNGVRVKVRAYGANQESQQELIQVGKQSAPTSITFSFDTTVSSGKDTTTASFTGDSDMSKYEYSTNGGVDWTSCDTVNATSIIDGLTKNNKDIKVRTKAGSDAGGVKIASDAVPMGTFTPSNITVAYDSSLNKLATSSNMEYSIDGGKNWYDGASGISFTDKGITDTTSSDNLTNLDATNGILVRTKAKGVQMASNSYKILVPSAPSASFTTPTVGSGKIKLTGTSNTMQYQIGGTNATWTDCVGSDEIKANVGDVIYVRTKAVNGQPPSPVTKLTVAATNIGIPAMPSITLSVGSNVGTTKINNLVSANTYEYVLDTSSAEPDWAHITPLTMNGVPSLDNITVGSNTYIHIRVQKTVDVPESATQTVPITSASIKQAP